MIFDSLDVHLIPPEQARTIDAAAASGSISVHLGDIQSTPVVLGLCTGFLASPHHVLTASHCVRRRLVFDQRHVALPESAAKIDVFWLGPTLRLRFTGESLSHREDVSGLPLLGEPSYDNPALDFAVFTLAAPLSSKVVNLVAVASAAEHASQGAERVRLYGYPSGVPLSESSNCWGVVSTFGDALLHDCDTLSGSSGALLVSAFSGRAVAMHLATTGRNERAYFEEAGHFEPPADLVAMASTCLPSTSADEPACSDEGMYNRALPLSALAADLMSAAPDLWADIAKASSE